MNKFSTLLVMVLLIASFQNCGKVQQADLASNKQNPGGEVTQYNKFSTSGYGVLSVWDYKRLQYLDIDLKSGEIRIFEEAGSAVGNTMQLKSEELAVAQATLAQAQVCEPVPQIQSPAENCNMMYRYPYAILVNRSDEVRLGEMTSGCDVAIDLCENKGREMKQWSSRIVEHLLDGTVTQ